MCFPEAGHRVWPYGSHRGILPPSQYLYTLHIPHMSPHYSQWARPCEPAPNNTPDTTLLPLAPSGQIHTHIHNIYREHNSYGFTTCVIITQKKKERRILLYCKAYKKSFSKNGLGQGEEEKTDPYTIKSNNLIIYISFW